MSWVSDLLLFMLILLVLFLGVGVLVYFYVRPTARALWVRKAGTRITARVTAIEEEINLVGRTTGYCIVAEWKDPRTQQKYRFRSEAGRKALKENHPPGSQITVLIDSRKPQRYEVVLQADEILYKGYADV